MKKFFTVFLISLIFSSAAFAKMGFQADFKGYAGGDIEIFTNYDKSVSNSSVLFTGSQLDLTLRFGSYVGITAGLGSSFSMYCFGNLCGDKYSASLLSNPP